jgi:hypothetical protein
MRGIPQTFGSVEDWKNAYSYAQSRGTEERAELVERLTQLKNTKTSLVLKKGVKKAPEDQTAVDFEAVDDPAGAFALSGLTETEINTMIAGLNA